MTEFPRAEASVLAARHALAEAVVAALQAAGLPVQSQETGTSWFAGASVEVDAGADPAGGVWVTWTPGREVEEPSEEALQRGQLDTPAIHVASGVAQVLTRAAGEVLALQGFTVRASDDEYRPDAVRIVTSG